MDGAVTPVAAWEVTEGGVATGTGGGAGAVRLAPYAVGEKVLSFVSDDEEARGDQ